MVTARQFDAGEVIFRENDIGETAYVIEHGQVEILKGIDGENVHIAYIGRGEPFGEMSIIDDKPRSATVVAVEKTTVREIHRDEFVQALQSQPAIALSLLKILFQRLRDANAAILQLHRSHPELRQLSIQSQTPSTALALSLDGLTSEAKKALPRTPFQITNFPFRIGRRSSDPLVNNDLSIPDSVPMQISRHHLVFVKQDGLIGVSDRGSRMGLRVDGQQLGGHGGWGGTLFFTRPESTLVLGDSSSPFKFRVSILAS